MEIITATQANGQGRLEIIGTASELCSLLGLIGVGLTTGLAGAREEYGGGRMIVVIRCERPTDHEGRCEAQDERRDRRG